MHSHTYQAQLSTATAAAVGTAFVHAAHLAYTEWTNRSKRPGKASANWPWRITLCIFVVAAVALITLCAVRESVAGVSTLDAISVTHVVIVEVS